MESDFPKIEYKRIGSIKERVSAIGLGTYGISDYKRAEEAFEYAIERGVNLIDTAEIYNTEDFVGRVLNRVGKENIFVTTKIWPNNLVSRDSVLKAARNSLKKLGIQTVDLILIHWPNNHMKIEDQVRNFEAVFSEGLTRYIGVSNFSVEQIEEARHSTTSAEIVCDQVKYNLSDRGAEKDIIPYCERNKIAVMAYTPIEKGKISRMKEIIEISRKIEKTPIQIALNFLASRNNVIPIPKTENLEHMKEIIGSQGWKLNSEYLERLEKSKDGIV